LREFTTGALNIPGGFLYGYFTGLYYRRGNMAGGFNKPDRSCLFNTSVNNTELFTIPDAKFADSETGNESRGRILVMDDEEFILDMADKMFSTMGYDVTLSGNGEDTISLYIEAKEKGKPFHCVIMDLTITDGMGGKEVIGILKNYDSDIRAIISSGYADDPVVSEFREYGFSGVALKPYSFNQISNLLDSVITDS